ncbi:unnamed protein product, partial [Symbiodinium necroappetens]
VAAASLGSQPVEQGGDSVRRMTSALARISQVLRSFVETPAQGQGTGILFDASSALDDFLLARALEMADGNP